MFNRYRYKSSVYVRFRTGIYRFSSSSFIVCENAFPSPVCTSRNRPISTGVTCAVRVCSSRPAAHHVGPTCRRGVTCEARSAGHDASDEEGVRARIAFRSNARHAVQPEFPDFGSARPAGAPAAAPRRPRTASFSFSQARDVLSAVAKSRPVTSALGEIREFRRCRNRAPPSARRCFLRTTFRTGGKRGDVRNV